MKNIQMNVPMTKAILDGRKTQFRSHIIDINDEHSKVIFTDIKIINNFVYANQEDNIRAYTLKQPLKDFIKQESKYKIGETIYVAEDYKIGGWNTESFAIDHSCEPYDTSWHTPENKYQYNELLGEVYDEIEELGCKDTWERFKSPLEIMDKSIMKYWMARIFLKITDVRVERLQDISYVDMVKEGVNSRLIVMNKSEVKNDFIKMWNKTAPKGYKYLDNPYVLVYEFERVEK